MRHDDDDRDLTKLLGGGPEVLRFVVDRHGHVRRSGRFVRQRQWVRILLPGVIGFVTAAIAVSYGLSLLH